MSASSSVSPASAIPPQIILSYGGQKCAYGRQRLMSIGYQGVLALFQSDFVLFTSADSDSDSEPDVGTTHPAQPQGRSSQDPKPPLNSPGLFCGSSYVMAEAEPTFATYDVTATFFTQSSPGQQVQIDEESFSELIPNIIGIQLTLQGEEEEEDEGEQEDCEASSVFSPHMQFVTNFENKTNTMWGGLSIIVILQLAINFAIASSEIFLGHTGDCGATSQVPTANFAGAGVVHRYR